MPWENPSKTLVLAALVCALSMNSVAAKSPFPKSTASPQPDPVAISTLLKPRVYQKVTEDREIMTHARLEEVSPQPFKSKNPLKNYTIYAAMLVNQSLEETRRVLTDYSLYSEMIPYVDRASYAPATHVLELAGGIWKFNLQSSLLMEENGDRWIAFRIVDGHFRGMRGNIFFERFNEKSTLVYLGGSLKGRQWPPSFVIERGAEVVFGFTGKKMRSYIEEQKKPTPAHPHPSGDKKDDRSIPQPRSRL
jgi:hypothetical protein